MSSRQNAVTRYASVDYNGERYFEPEWLAPRIELEIDLTASTTQNKSFAICSAKKGDQLWN